MLNLNFPRYQKAAKPFNYHVYFTGSKNPARSRTFEAIYLKQH